MYSEYDASLTFWVPDSYKHTTAVLTTLYVQLASSLHCSHTASAVFPIETIQEHTWPLTSISPLVTLLDYSTRIAPGTSAITQYSPVSDVVSPGLDKGNSKTSYRRYTPTPKCLGEQWSHCIAPLNTDRIHAWTILPWIFKNHSTKCGQLIVRKITKIVATRF